MIAECGHYALVLALGLALIQSFVPLIGAKVNDPALMNVSRSTALVPRYTSTQPLVLPTLAPGVM